MSSLTKQWKIQKVADANPARTSSVLIAGPPGTGKSTFAGSAAELPEQQPVLLVALLGREVESWKYQANNVDYVLINDPDWSPSLGTIKKIKDAAGKTRSVYEGDGTLLTKGFQDFVQLCLSLREDDHYRTIIVDPGTELAEMCWRYSLSPHNVPTPALLAEGSRYLPYETLDIHMTDAILKITSLSLPSVAKKPKDVIITWHVRKMAEEEIIEGVGKRESADKRAEDAEYEGKILPQIRGQFRRKLMGYVSSYIYTFTKPKLEGITTKGTEYLLQVQTDPERHVKLVGPPPPMKHIPNDFKEFKNLLAVQQGKMAKKAVL